MATIQIEGRLTGHEDEDTGLWKWIELDEESLDRLLLNKLDGKRLWATYDFGRVRITIEQLGTPEEEAKLQEISRLCTALASAGERRDWDGANEAERRLNELLRERSDG